MADLPPCRSLGRQCRALDVVLRVADLHDDTPAEQDALATWLTGHTQRLAFGQPFREGGALLIDAVIHVPCKYLTERSAQANGGKGPAVYCQAHGFAGALPREDPPASPSFRRDPNRFFVVQRGKRRVVEMRARPAPRRALPVLAAGNPCVGAPCRTADNTQGAACCRDLTLDVVLEGEQPGLLELLRARQPPYLCKVVPDGNGVAECEVISACGYLEADAVTCGLHNFVRPDGEAAKPFVCSQWPELEPDQAAHPGCRLV